MLSACRGLTLQFVKHPTESIVSENLGLIGSQFGGLWAASMAMVNNKPGSSYKLQGC